MDSRRLLGPSSPNNFDRTCEMEEDTMSVGSSARILNNDRRNFIGGSDARILMGQDEKALIRLWQEKRGEVGPEDPSTNLIVQLGLVTEDLNRQWYERNTGNAVGRAVPHQAPGHPVDGGHPRWHRGGSWGRRLANVEP